MSKKLIFGQIYTKFTVAMATWKNTDTIDISEFYQFLLYLASNGVSFKEFYSFSYLITDGFSVPRA